MSMNIIKLIKNNQQKLRFAAVGAVNTTIDFGIFSVLVLTGVPSIVANYPATTIALVFSYFANKRFTFRSSSPRIIHTMALFFGVTLVGLWIIQPVIIHFLEPGLKEWIGQDYLGSLVAKVCATCTTLCWNYILYKRLVFRKPDITT